MLSPSPTIICDWLLKLYTSQANSTSKFVKIGGDPTAFLLYSRNIYSMYQCTKHNRKKDIFSCRHWMSYIDVKPLTVMKLISVNYWIICRQNCFLSLITKLNAESHLVLIIAGWLVHTHPVLVDSCKLEVHILCTTHHSTHVNTYVTYVPLGLVAGRSSSECWQKFSDTLKAALLRPSSLQEVVDNYPTTA